ncbi:hypothetical protein SZ64_04445 [Erythrobacter sp. SG61-1L]|uniref:gpW family head-tail joining protein n=1 Tax=Erythrobacter sp. SG61-1L TaxID=1603897 RepID=UPI0006C8FC12|nr:gpW family head-tail joining protein [Erythrobacter sp. SG61-1L]KPL67419.1 hypothetical protein SZ64_04445 [Erythrobacter sp. SG61-1L]
MTTQRTTTEILADLADTRAARSALLKGERIEDVSRDGRRMRLATVSLEELDTAILNLEREYQEAVNAEAGKPRRSAIGFYY